VIAGTLKLLHVLLEIFHLEGWAECSLFSSSHLSSIFWTNSSTNCITNSSCNDKILQF